MTIGHFQNVLNEFTTAAAGAALTVDFHANGIAQAIPLNSGTPCALTFTPYRNAVKIVLRYVQDATGGRDVVYPGSVLGTPPSLNMAPNASTIVELYWNGTNYYFAKSGFAAGSIPVSTLSPGSNGQALITTGGVAAWGNNFGAQNLTTTGALILGTNPASAGDIRLEQGARIYARSFPNTGDIAVLDVGVTGGADTLTLGGNTGVPLAIIGSPVTITASGGFVVGVGATGYNFFSSNCQFGPTLMRFVGGSCTIKVDATALAGATGGLTALVGQDSTGTGATVGGALLIRSGTGATNGTFEMRAGTTSFLDFGITSTVRATFGNSALGTQIVGNSLFFNAGGVQMGLTSASLNIQQSAITFNQVSGSPIIFEADDATAGGTGHLFTIHARNETGTGATTGGKLLLASGSGATNGALELKNGTVSALLFNNTTADFNANQLVTTGSYKVNNTTGFVQVGTDTASASSEAAQSGTLRLYYGASCKGRSSAFTSDVLLWDWAATTASTFTLGSTSGVNLSINSIGPMQINVGGSSYIFYDNGATPRIDLGGQGLSLLASGLVKILNQAVNSVNGLPLILQGQNSVGTGTLGGDVQLVPGTGTTHNGNIALGAAPANWQGGAGILFIANDTSLPSGGSPASGGFLFVDAGALKYKGSSGTNTTLAAA